MSDTKAKQPIIPQKRKDAELRAVFEKYFPGALQPKDGGYVIDRSMLQTFLSPENGEMIDEGFELRWVGKKGGISQRLYAKRQDSQTLARRQRQFCRHRQHSHQGR